MTSCRLVETLSTGIFDMRPTEASLAIKNPRTGSGGHVRKSKNVCKILTLETNCVCSAWRDRFRDCEVAEYVENLKSTQF